MSLHKTAIHPADTNKLNRIHPPACPRARGKNKVHQKDSSSPPHEPAQEVESHLGGVGGEAAHPDGPAHLADGVLGQQEHLDGGDEGGAALNLLLLPPCVGERKRKREREKGKGKGKGKWKGKGTEWKGKGTGKWKWKGKREREMDRG